MPAQLKCNRALKRRHPKTDVTHLSRPSSQLAFLGPVVQLRLIVMLLMLLLRRHLRRLQTTTILDPFRERFARRESARATNTQNDLWYLLF
jgi:hypothetical protein